MVLVSGAVREPLERQATSVIAHGVIGAAVVAGAVLVVAVVFPDPPLRRLVWTVTACCLAIAAVSTVVGVAVRNGLRHAREVQRPQPQRAAPAAWRPGRRVVIDGCLADPDPAHRRPIDGR